MLTIYFLLSQTLQKDHENFLIDTMFTYEESEGSKSHPAKIDLNKKWLPKQKTVQNFNIDAQGFRKTRNENPPTQEIGVTS